MPQNSDRSVSIVALFVLLHTAAAGLLWSGGCNDQADCIDCWPSNERSHAVTTVTGYDYTLNGWETDYREELEYDSFGRLTAYTGYYRPEPGMDLEESSGALFHYDDHGLLVRAEWWDDDGFYPEDWVYDSQGRVTTIQGDYYRAEFSYENGRLVGRLQLSESGGQWTPDYRWSYQFDTLGRHVAEIREEESGGWELLSRTEYTYGSDGNLAHTHYEFYDEGIPNPISDLDHTFDAAGFLVESAGERCADNGGGMGMVCVVQRDVYERSNDGRLMTETHFYDGRERSRWTFEYTPVPHGCTYEWDYLPHPLNWTGFRLYGEDPNRYAQ